MVVVQNSERLGVKPALHDTTIPAHLLNRTLTDNGSHLIDVSLHAGVDASRIEVIRKQQAEKELTKANLTP